MGPHENPPGRPIVDRTDEQRELRALLGRARPALALLNGRRRVGKTYLLTNLWPAEQLFLFTASRTTPEENRQQLLKDLAAWSSSHGSQGDPIVPAEYPTWRTVFRLLIRIALTRAANPDPQPTVIVLDEFQYLGDGDAGVAAVASELNAVWESRDVAQARDGTLPLLIVLAGSALSTMEALAAGGSPLFGRFAWKQMLRPFDYAYAAELAGLPGLRDKAVAYGLFGGTPRYLAAIDPQRNIEENVCSLLLSPRGEVRLLVETALDQEEGLREVSKYRAILRAVADGCTERNTIAQRAGVSNDKALRDKLGTLVTLGYLEERRNIDAKPSSAIRYRLADAAFRFYYQFVAAHHSMLERYPAERVWRAEIAPQLDSYMGFEFEQIAREAYDRRGEREGLPLVEQWGRWEGVDRQGAPLEIDLLAPLSDGRMLSGSVKWDRDPIDAAVHHQHVAMLRRAADAGRKWAHAALEPNAPLYYAAAGGFTSRFRQAVEASGHPAILWSLEDMYGRRT